MRWARDDTGPLLRVPEGGAGSAARRPRRWRRSPAPRSVGLSVRVFLGDRDTDLRSDEAGRWRHATRVRTRLEIFPGDHLYLVPQRHAVLAALRRVLAMAS